MEEFMLNSEESDYDCNEEEKVRDSDLIFNSTLNCADPEVTAKLPCLVCGDEVDESIIKTEVNCGYGEDNSGCGYLSKENGEIIFNWFLKWFRVDILKKGKGALKKRGWDGEGGSPLQFCGGCKIELGKLWELQVKVEELEKEIREGMGEVKGKMGRCEEIVERTGIYERDQRYRKVRSRIVPNVKSRAGEMRTSLQAEEETPKRKSGRPKKNQMTKLLEEANSQVHVKDFVVPPVVMLSSSDKFTADQHLLTNDPLEDNTEDPVAMEIERSPLRRPKRKASLKKRQGDDLEDDLDEDWLPLPPPPLPKRKRKRPPPKDEDFIPEPENDPLSQDNVCSDTEDPDAGISPDESEEEDDLVDSAKKNRKFKEDPLNNLLTYGKFRFTILPEDPTPFSSSTSPTAPAPAPLSVQCNLCDLVLPKNKGSIRVHVFKSHTNRYACVQCPLRFSAKSNLQRHVLKIHEGQSVAKVHSIDNCKICGKPVNKSGLKRHEWSHMNKEEREEALKTGQVPDCFRKRWQCDECGHKFGGQYGLKRHLKRRHGVGGGEGGEGEMLELCPECGGRYKDLRSHLRMGHNEKGKGWECLEEGCGKKFKILSQLAKHKDMVHRKIKRWSCPQCPRQFWGERYYRDHLNNHLGIRPWKCEDCESDFTAKAALKNHRKIFHEPGSKPKRKSYKRGPTVLKAGVKQEELRRRGEYFPPSALATWAKGREPAEGHVRKEIGDGVGEELNREK